MTSEDLAAVLVVAIMIVGAVAFLFLTRES